MRARGAALLFAAVAGAALAHEHPQHQPGAAPTAGKRGFLAISVTFDKAGRLWRVRGAPDGVWVDHSDDRGAHFEQPVKASSEVPAADGELAPEIGAGPQGQIFVSYTLPRAASPYVGHIRFVSSHDGGKTFAPALTVNDNRDEITHRFQSMLLDASGAVHLAWIDKRDLEAAKARKENYSGAAIYYARMKDGRFEPNVKVADHSCECCRIGLALDPSGTPVALWRHIFEDGSRDHALARIGGPVQRASRDGWRIDACPHHGPALAIEADGTRHLAWFTGAEGREGLHYQAQRPDGSGIAPPRRVGGEGAGYPALLAVEGAVHLAWKEFDGSANRVFVQSSKDGGRTWSSARELAASKGPVDRPRLVAYGNQSYVSLNARNEGYRLMALDEAK